MSQIEQVRKTYFTLSRGVVPLGADAGPEAFAGGLAVVPKFGLSVLPTLSVLKVVAPYALTMATVGLVESLLTLQLIDGIADDGTRGSTGCLSGEGALIAAVIAEAIADDRRLASAESESGCSRIAGVRAAAGV